MIGNRFGIASIPLVLFILVTVSACATGPKNEGAVDGSGVQVAPVDVGEDAGSVRVDPDSVAGRAPAERVIYFDFDAVDIRTENLELIRQHGRFLAQNPDGRVRLEGHTDERGTREYNVALGEGRSKAIARIMQLQGVSSAQMRSVSYGEELPIDEAHNEAAWAKNRRVNIIYEVE